MKRARVIPVLLLKNGGLYKTEQFKKDRYVGDPINAVRIFNEKHCDELIFLDISATKQGKEIDFRLIEEIANECFMPFAYGGGVQTLNQIEKLLKLGIEKIVFNSVFLQSPSFITEAALKFGNSTIVASVDIKVSIMHRHSVYSHAGYDIKGLQLIPFLRQIEDSGAGEIMINSVDRDGMMNGYDLDLARRISSELSVPVVFCGGCGHFNDIKKLLTESSVSAAAAGSLFVFQGPHKGVLISYPSPEDIENIYLNKT